MSLTVRGVAALTPGIILQEVLDRPHRAAAKKTRPAGFLRDEEDQTERRSHGTEPGGTEELRAALHSPDHTPLTRVATPRRRGGGGSYADRWGGEGGAYAGHGSTTQKRQSDTKTSRTAGLVFTTTHL